jgi:uridine kinase
MIIHIAGTSGSGKTYIGDLFKKDCNVIDLDDWTEEFNKKKNKNNIILNLNKNKLPPNFKTIEDLEKKYNIDYNNYVTELNYTLSTSSQIINFIKNTI